MGVVWVVLLIVMVVFVMEMEMAVESILQTQKTVAVKIVLG